MKPKIAKHTDFCDEFKGLPEEHKQGLEMPFLPTCALLDKIPETSGRALNCRWRNHGSRVAAKGHPNPDISIL